jgi:hypothetical protein
MYVQVKCLFFEKTLKFGVKNVTSVEKRINNSFFDHFFDTFFEANFKWRFRSEADALIGCRRRRKDFESEIVSQSLVFAT